MDWPESHAAAHLGNGRHAVALDRPESTDSLRESVLRRASEGFAIYPQGGRTSLDYGGIPRRPGVALNTSAIDNVIDYPAADMTVTIGAGITLAKLQSVLAAERQFLPLDAPQPEKATLGGIYATNTSGPRRFGWGRPRDLIIGVSFVTADGKEIKGGGRVVKNVAGYDFPKLMTGSMGTLGIITQMTLKTRPKPGASALVCLPFERNEDLAAAVGKLNTSETRPVAIEVLNASAVGRVGHEIEAATWNLIVGFEDNRESVRWQIEKLVREVGKSRSEVAIFEDAEPPSLWQALTEFPANDTEGPLSFTANLARSKAIPFALNLDPARWAIKVQPASGIVVAHGSADESTFALLATIRAAALSAGGNLIVSRCPTDWKTRMNVWGDRRGEWTIMERIKSALDPGAVLNPGRFVGTI